MLQLDYTRGYYIMKNQMTRRNTGALTLLVQLISCGNAQVSIKII